jgi:hypothetical protein
MDLGLPISYMVLAEGTLVISSDGRRVGTVAHVLAATDVDVFDGVIVHTPRGWRFVDAPEIASLYERGVLLTLTAQEAERLPAPSRSPAVMSAGPDDTVPDHLADKLRRAWQKISGDY